MSETATSFTPPPLKRCAIIGTAQSWNQCPWQDTTLEVWCLNDAYLIGVPRADRWFDLHPFHQMVFRDATNRVVPAEGVPIGGYLRPHGHLDWLKSRQFPVYLQEHRPDWPNYKPFPMQDLLKFFQPYWPYRLTRQGVQLGKDYETSSPALMVMLAIMEGYREIHVYGIHLATQWEYVEQRPNFEWLLGLAAGMGIKIVLPESTPICKGRFRYAYEQKADLPMQEAERTVGLIKQEGAKLHQEIARLPWHAWERKKDLAARLKQLDVDLADARGQQSRLVATTRV